MVFIIDKEELKPGLIIFRRADVAHRNWYCRIRLPRADRYKTYSLKTPNIEAAKEQAFDFDADVRFRLKHDVPVFNRPFIEVAREYLATQVARSKRGEISAERPKKLRAIIEGALSDYAGATQVHLIGDELWEGYPAWRRENGAGRFRRNGTREVSAAMATAFAEREAAARAKALQTRGIRHRKAVKAEPATDGKRVAFISDSTIKLEMSVFGAIMSFAIKKRYCPASTRFDDRPRLKVMRRDEFTPDEYRKLHTVGRQWVKAATTAGSLWYRTVTYNFILVMCNTGMRPSEARNLRWRDITPAKDREGREIVVLFVQGKGKSRKLVAPSSVGDYLERIRAIAKATAPEAPVFTTINGESTRSLYKALIGGLLDTAQLREGVQGVPRSTYCFRHTYATMRLHEGVDVYFLSEQMGTSVKMIEDHYGHVDTIKHADRVLAGMSGWEPLPDTDPDHDRENKKAGAAQAIKAKQPKRPPKKR